MARPARTQDTLYLDMRYMTTCTSPFVLSEPSVGHMWAVLHMQQDPIHVQIDTSIWTRVSSADAEETKRSRCQKGENRALTALLRAAAIAHWITYLPDAKVTTGKGLDF